MSVDSMHQSRLETTVDHMQTFPKPTNPYYPTNNGATAAMLLTEDAAELPRVEPPRIEPPRIESQHVELPRIEPQHVEPQRIESPPCRMPTPQHREPESERVIETPIIKNEHENEIVQQSNTPEVAIKDEMMSESPDIDMKMEKPADYDDMLPSPDFSGSINSETAMSPSSINNMQSPATAEMSHSSTPDHMRNGDMMKMNEQSMSSEWNEDASTTIDADGRETYYCHLCSYSGNSKFHFNSHMNSHFEHHCQHCDYTSRTEGRLKKHIKDFHSQVPPPNYSGQARIVRNGNIGRPKVYRCKQCEFISQTKEEFWEHARSHIKEDKILQCPKCPFVTEYKHHLEYHLRNHFGSKPFKCTKCNYSCVNKSMLNSHMKSHTNVYQFRCADCTYATKYCHSLKLHLRKYNHKPASVLNLDGTVDETYDCSTLLSPKRGPPRGPRGPRKDKMDISPPHPPSGMMGLPPPLGGVRPPPGMLPNPYWPVQNGVHIPPPPLIPVSSGLTALQAQMMHPNSQPGHANLFRCTVCGFKSEFKDELSRHMLSVHARENQDLFSMFGINSEALMEEHLKKMQASEHHQQMLERQNSLHVRTEHDGQPIRSGPTSWPMVHGDEPQPKQPHPSQSLPELYAEKKLVIDESGKRPKESGGAPLDLTKPKDFEDGMYGGPMEEGPGTDDDSQNPWNSQPERKNRRKGRAFKLDALCLKLQEKCDNSGELIDEDGAAVQEGESDKTIPTTSTPIMTKADAKENQKDENHNGTAAIDYGAIHESISKLNNEAAQQAQQQQFVHKKYRHGNGQSEMEERQRMIQAYNEQQKMLFLQQQQAQQHHHHQQQQQQMHGFPMMPPTSTPNMLMYQHRQMNGIAVANKLPEATTQLGKAKESYECQHCDIAFRDCIMYTMHMGYHGYQSPFKCNMCGHESKDKVEFFLHIARVAHA